MGYVIAYSVSGVLADFIGKRTAAGVGRGAAWVIGVSGICLVIISALTITNKDIRELEK
ncbi:hypothetical protein [Cellulosilyticum ruminicola]|uniref:hypothetical protein n=1 Tax=Cellulosilyticum ruminicola TaxID=425254 RepID=UPI0012EE774A|nr:hypothetical protein [Cellulosilyticum ruminicola]